MSELRIASDLALPPDAVTQAIGILARRGAGKTYTATVLVEEVIGAGLPVVVLDPTGAWWGLRSSADGTQPGLSVVILGGEHGDVPLEPTAGKLIADVVVDHPGAYVIDLSGFESKRAEQAFSADFLERLYRAKGKRPEPLLVVVDEADMFAPQRPGTEQLRSLGALESIVRRGRIRGLGVVLISQRAAVLNKNVLTQIEVLIALQTTAPQDRRAVKEWVVGHATEAEAEDFAGSLAGLERGEAWVWSPSWLRILQRVRIRQRRTFDSSKTPEAGTAAIEPRAFAPVDLASLGERIAATAETAKANDPAALRRRVAELERQLAAVPEPEIRIERIEVPVLNGQVKELETILGGFTPASGQIAEAAAFLTTVVEDVRRVADSILTAVGTVQTVPLPVAPRPMTRPAVAHRPAPRVIAPPDSDKRLGKAERLILAALAQYPQGRTKVQIALLAGYAHSGGAFNNALGALRSAGLAEGGAARVVVTDAGLTALGDWTPLPTGRALMEHWLGQLGKAERAILSALADVYPNALDKASLGAATGYEPTGGAFNNALGRLRTLELIERGTPRLSDELA